MVSSVPIYLSLPPALIVCLDSILVHDSAFLRTFPIPRSTKTPFVLFNGATYAGSIAAVYRWRWLRTSRYWIKSVVSDPGFLKSDECSTRQDACKAMLKELGPAAVPTDPNRSIYVGHNVAGDDDPAEINLSKTAKWIREPLRVSHCLCFPSPHFSLFLILVLVLNLCLQYHELQAIQEESCNRQFSRIELLPMSPGATTGQMDSALTCAGVTHLLVLVEQLGLTQYPVCLLEHLSQHILLELIVLGFLDSFRSI